MIIDSSALFAILLQEPEAERLVRAIAGDPLLFKGDDFTKTDIIPVVY